MPRTIPHVGPIAAVIGGVLIATAVPTLGIALPGPLGSKSHTVGSQSPSVGSKSHTVGSKSHTVGSKSHTVGSKSPARKANLNLKFVSAEFYSYTNPFYNQSGTFVRVTFRFDCSSGDPANPYASDATATLVQGSTTATSSVVSDPDAPTREGGSGEVFCVGKNTTGYAFFDPTGFQPGTATGSVTLYDYDLEAGSGQLVTDSDGGTITGTKPGKGGPKTTTAAPAAPVTGPTSAPGRR